MNRLVVATDQVNHLGDTTEPQFRVAWQQTFAEREDKRMIGFQM